MQIKNKVKGSIKKFDDLNIPLNIYERKQTRTQPCTSKSREILSAEVSENETEEIKNQLKIAPVINLEEFEFLGASSLAIETENGLYHHKDNKLDNVCLIEFLTIIYCILKAICLQIVLYYRNIKSEKLC